MYKNNLQHLYKICTNNKNLNKNSRKPYRAKNLLTQKNQAKDVFSLEIPLEMSIEEYLEQYQGETGFVDVSALTALGALPVEGAVVTIYTVDEEDGEEIVLYHLITNSSGQAPIVELPVFYDPENPSGSSEFFFTTYNLRAEAAGYYTVNILNIRVFPDTTTLFRIDFIPVAAGVDQEEQPSQTFVIPPSPIDISNE